MGDRGGWWVSVRELCAASPLDDADDDISFSAMHTSSFKFCILEQGKIETIKTTALLNRLEYSWRAKDTCCYFNFREELHLQLAWKKNNVQMPWIWSRVLNLKAEAESLLTEAQNVIRTIYVDVKVDKKQQNSKCRLCSDRDERVNHIICEHKLA